MTHSVSEQHDQHVEHQSVMVTECLDLLAPALERPGGVLVDATLGLGGHSAAALTRFDQLRIIGIDRDEQALAIASDRLARWGDRVSVHHYRYDQLEEALADAGVDRVDGILFDLGVSSLQLDLPQRGFSYARDAPLDMRMNPNDPVSAADILNTWDGADIAKILRDYAQERFASRIAREIVARREIEPWRRTADLVQLVDRCIPAATKRTGGHPAKRTFQALRIAVNGELDSWEQALPLALEQLNLGGRMAVLAYHSLEDRLVKHVVTSRARSSTPSGLPMELPGHAPWLRWVTRGAVRPGQTEVSANPRATSARLRVVERIQEGS